MTGDYKESIINNGIFILDTGASNNMVTREHAIDQIRLKETKRIIIANGKEEKVEMIYDELIGNTCVINEAPFNLISLGQMINQGWIERTNEKYDKKLIKNGIELNFERKDNLWVLDRAWKANVACLLLTSGQEKSIQKYIDLHERLGHKNDTYIRKTIQSHAIRIDMTLQEFDWASRNTEECIACLQAKHKEHSKQTSSRIKSNIPGETVHIDIMEYRKVLFLIMVDEFTGFTLGSRINSKDKKSLLDTLTKLLSELYSYPNATSTTTIYCDRESAITSIKSHINEKKIQLILFSTSQHDGQVERFIQTIESTARTIEMSLSYEITDDMIPLLIYYSIQCMNITTNSHLMADSDTPFHRVTGKEIHFNKNISCQFGEILLFQVPDMKRLPAHTERLEWGIVVGRDILSQGDITVKLIDNGEIVHRYIFVRPDHCPEKIIKVINGMNDNNQGTNEREDMEEYIANTRVNEVDQVRSHKYNTRSQRDSNSSIKITNEYIGSVHSMPQEKKEIGLKKEIQQFIDKNVFIPVNSDEVGDQQIIRLFVVYAEKGDEVKARIVANGKQQSQEPMNPWEVSATTASIVAILTLISAAVNRDLKLFSFDISGAYLHAPIDEVVYVRFDDKCTKILLDIKPEFSKWKRSDNTLVARLIKSLYGLRQSGLNWQREFTSALESINYRPLIQDPTIFKCDNNIAVTYVDDVLTAVDNEMEKTRIISELEKKYGKIKYSNSNRFKFRGLDITQSSGVIKINQTEVINRLIEEYGVTKSLLNPPIINLNKIENEKQTNTEEYRTIVAKLLYVANMTRPDIKVHMSLLSTKCENPSQQDFNLALKVLRYLAVTRYLGLVVTKGEMKINASIDATFSSHPSAVGQSGIAIFCDANLLASTSNKQAQVAKSSAEAEILALDDGLDDILYLKEILLELGFPQTIINIEQDNLSSIRIIKGSGLTPRTKHIRRREMRILQYIRSGEIDIVKVDGEDIVADALTKTLQGAKFMTKRNTLLGT